MGILDSTAETRALNLGVNPSANLSQSGSAPGFALPGGTTTISAGDDQNATVNTTNNVSLTVTDQGTVDQAFTFAEETARGVLGIASDVSADGRDIANRGFDLVEYLASMAESILGSGQGVTLDAIASNENVSSLAITEVSDAYAGAGDLILAGTSDALNFGSDALAEVSDAYAGAGDLILAGSVEAIRATESISSDALAEVSDAYAGAGDLILDASKEAVRTTEAIAANSTSSIENVALATVDGVLDSQALTLDTVSDAYQGAGQLLLDGQTESLEFINGRLADYEQNQLDRERVQLGLVTGVVEGANETVLAQTAANESLLLESSRAITDNLKTALSFVRSENAGESGLVVEVVKYVGLTAVGLAVAWGASRAFAK